METVSYILLILLTSKDVLIYESAILTRNYFNKILCYIPSFQYVRISYWYPKLFILVYFYRRVNNTIRPASIELECNDTERQKMLQDLTPSR